MSLPSNKGFKQLQKLWYQKLAQSGFNDIEYPNGMIKVHNLRTQAFEQRDQISEFFTRLEKFLRDNEVSRQERDILVLYSQGTHLNKIHKILNIKPWSAKGVITKYRKIIR